MELLHLRLETRFRNFYTNKIHTGKYNCRLFINTGILEIIAKFNSFWLEIAPFVSSILTSKLLRFLGIEPVQSNHYFFYLIFNVLS